MPLAPPRPALRTVAADIPSSSRTGPTSPWIGIRRAAEILEIPPRSVMSLIRNGHLTAVGEPGLNQEVLRSEVEALRAVADATSRR